MSSNSFKVLGRLSRTCAIIVLVTAISTCGIQAQPKKVFSLDFAATDIADVMKALAVQSGANVAVSSSAKGQVTLRLSEVDLDQALEIVTSLTGNDYACVNGAYIVGTREEVKKLAARSYATRTVQASNLGAEGVAQVMQTVGKAVPRSDEVSLAAIAGTGSFMLVGPVEAIDAVEAAISSADQQAASGPTPTEMVSLKYLPASQVKGMLSGAALDVAVSEGPPGTVILAASRATIEKAKEFIKAADVVPPINAAERYIYTVRYAEPGELAETLQKLVPGLAVVPGPRTFTPRLVAEKSGAAASAMEALAAPAFGASAEAGAGTAGQTGFGPGATTARGGELAPITVLILIGARHQIEEALKLCEQLDVAPRQIFISATITEVSRDKVTQLGIDWTGMGGTQVKWGESPAVAKGVAGNERDIEIGKWVRSPVVIESVLQALVTDNKAKILAKPNVALLEGRQATIHAGNTIYYNQTVGYSPISGMPIKQAGQIRAGVILMVTGRLSPDGCVTLTLVPTVSAVVGWVDGLPNINERSTVTTVRVKSGESIVLGGLVQEDETITVTEVPFLSKLPVVGQFFRHTRKNPIHRELLIVITPTIKES